MEDKKPLIEKKKTIIDFGKLFRDMGKHKKTYYKVLACTMLFAVIYTLSLPNYYKCTVKLSPELSSRRTTNSLSSLASSFGINISGVMGNSTEALFPTLYPDLMNSVDFKTSLFPIPVTIEGKKKKGEMPEKSETMTYYDYLKDRQKRPWWSAAKSAFFSLFKSHEEDSLLESKVDPFRLTKQQTAIAKAIDRKVVCDVDKKTMLITITVTDQNPLICATIADSVKTRLQNFITDYRTSKVRVDLKYNEKLYAETKARYDKARKLYADFADSNQDVILESVRQRQSELENEMQLQYNAYQQVAVQLLAAKAKVQEETPAFTTLQSATVPVRKAGPGRAKICLLLLFLAFLGTTVWVFHKEGDLKPLLGIS